MEIRAHLQAYVAADHHQWDGLQVRVIDGHVGSGLQKGCTLTVLTSQESPPDDLRCFAGCALNKMVMRHGVKDEVAQNPRMFLQAITLPVHEVLKSTTLTFHIQDMSHHECCVIVDLTGGRRKVNQRAQRTL